MNFLDSEFLKEIEEEMETVPFGNSCFLNENLTTHHETKPRRKQFILLQIDRALEGLQAAKFARDLDAIKIKQCRKKIKWHFWANKEKLRVEIAQCEWGIHKQEKLIRDAYLVISEFYKELKKLPKFTREEFEASEREYWEKRMARTSQLQFQSKGTIDWDIIDQLDKLGLEARVQIDEKNNQKHLLIFKPELQIEEKK
jgi:hypothetical protein